ncbi:hypothetical protein [uncultured Rhodoferax sp.]|mgnify:CR=1 FL=1|uniref:hypothetical protein n=1 Tax=uncultured Rhodoferax sp. TaxID=223188 RepID=UPI0025D2FF12|nr:hypothetical protein [uncultured Rhodoferax sp.]
MTPDKPSSPAAPGTPGAVKAYDALLDPLPLPEVSESDTDTAWGLWEASVGGLLEEGKAAPEAPPPHGYEPTQPAGLEGDTPSADKT